MTSKQKQRGQLRIKNVTAEQVEKFSLKHTLGEIAKVEALDLTRIHPANVDILGRYYGWLKNRVSQENKPPLEREADAGSEDLVGLTDSGYIRWMGKKEWSLTQAIYLLHGYVPPKMDSSIDQLIQLVKGIPDTKSIFENLPKLKYEKIRKCPEDWAFQMLSGLMGVTLCWKAIFPKCIPEDLEHICGEIPVHLHRN